MLTTAAQHQPSLRDMEPKLVKTLSEPAGGFIPICMCCVVLINIQKKHSNMFCAGLSAQVEPVCALTALCTVRVFLVTKHPGCAFKLPQIPMQSGRERKKKLKTCFNQGFSNKVIRGSGSSGACRSLFN